MKRLAAVLVILVLAAGLLNGCGGKDSTQSTSQSGAQPSQTETKPAGGATLQQLRKAATDAGYHTSDDYVNFLKDVKAGFTVQVVADNQDVRYFVVECATEEAAMKNAADIDAAGYNVAVRNGKLLSSYGVKNKGKIHAEIVTSIMAGKPIKP